MGEGREQCVCRVVECWTDGTTDGGVLVVGREGDFSADRTASDGRMMHLSRYDGYTQEDINTR